jgi:transposase-like protein
MTNRRKYDPDFKVRVVLEMISGQKGLMHASREYGIKDTVLSRWKQEFLERASQVFENP